MAAKVWRLEIPGWTPPVFAAVNNAVVNRYRRGRGARLMLLASLKAGVPPAERPRTVVSVRVEHKSSRPRPVQMYRAGLNAALFDTGLILDEDAPWENAEVASGDRRTLVVLREECD